MLDLDAQKTRAERVKRTQPHIVRRLADERVNAVTHLARRLVRKRDGEDAVRRHVVRQKIGNAVSQNTRLARACARHDEQRSLETGNGALLRLVQPLKQIHESSFSQ